MATNQRMAGILKLRNILLGFGGRVVHFAILTLAKKKSTNHSKQTWQYVAVTKDLASASEAKLAFDLLNRQITDCRLPLGDSNITVLKPLDFDR